MRLTGRLAKVERTAKMWLARTSARDQVIVISWADDWQDDWRGPAPVAVVDGDLLDALTRTDATAAPAPAPAPDAVAQVDEPDEPAPAPDAAQLYGFRESTLQREPHPPGRRRARAR